MKKSTLIILIVIGIVVIIGAVIGIMLITRKPAPPPPEEIVLTPEERARLILTEEERRAGMTLEEKEKKMIEERKKALERAKVPEEVKVVRIDKIIDKKVKFVTYSADKQKLLYFDPAEKEFFTCNLDGTEKNVITRASLENLYDVSWARTKDKLILVFSADKGKTKEYHFFNLAEQTDIKLDRRMQNVVFSFDGTKVAYQWVVKKEGIFNLSVSDPDGKNWRKIKALGEQRVVLDWFSENNVAVFDQPSAYEQGNLYIYDVIEGKPYYALTTEKYGLSAKFSRHGKKVIYNASSIKASRFPNLYVSDVKKGAVAKKIPISTLVEKCTWAQDNVTIYCGVPENYSNYFIQPNDYYEGRFISRDSFYKINTETGEQLKIAAADQFDKDYDVYLPFISDDGKTMYFTRKHDGKFYALRIP